MTLTGRAGVRHARSGVLGVSMRETLEKVNHDLEIASDGLMTALHAANAVEALVLLPIIKQVAEARNSVAALRAAKVTIGI